jgi:GDP-4-dehydro-6-deoxy-D-mannose reductase
LKILVTGGGGFAGRHLLSFLLERGPAEISATVLGEVPASIGFDDRVRWLSLDILADDSIRDVLTETDPDQIYHLAGQASVGRSFDDPVETWEINGTGTLRLLTELGRLAKRNRRMLVTSSAEVYGAVNGDAKIREEASIRPITPYGASKAAAEVASFQMGPAAGVEVVVARSFNHIGPGQDDRFVLPSVARQLARMRHSEDRVLSVGNLGVERDFLDVRDVVRAYVCLMERGAAGEAYNVCSGEGRTLKSVVERLIDLSRTGARLEIDPERMRAVDIQRLVGDPDRLRSLGWSPSIDLDSTLRSLLEEAERS